MKGPAGCTGTFTKASVATMRQGAAGCYELDGVITIAVTPVGANTKSVTLYVQDAAGGVYSAMKVSCSSTSATHMCTAFATAKNVLAGRTVTLQGQFTKSSAAKGGFEAFYLDSITDSAAGTPPTPTTLAQADLERSTTTASTGSPTAAYWFQMVTANVTDKLVMFDWSPPEFKGTGTCPQYGFGLTPMSAGSTAGTACSGTTQPAGQATVNPKEVLVGTSFYSGFKYTTDCACAAMYMSPLPTAGQGVTGTVSGILGYEVPTGQTVGYLYLEPLKNADFMIQ
jgi:hypothetical protein